MGELYRGKILIVDDTSENRTLLVRILSNEGYQVQSVENGVQAVEFIQTDPPDLILLDIAMPDMDGLETCACIKADKNSCDIPVIFISALDATEDKVKAFHAGGVDYITKPFDDEEVKVRVENHLALLKLRLELQAANRALAERLEELDRSQRLLHEREQKLQAFVNAIPDLSFVFDEEGRFLEVLTNETSLLTAQIDDLKGNLLKNVMPQDVAEKILGAIRRTLATGKTEVIEYKATVLDGEQRWFEGRIALLDKDESGHHKVVLIAREITERVHLYQEVRRLAMEDPLTGCFNRRHFFTLAEQELKRCVRYQHHLSLIMLDLDHFKNVNDRFGHPAGDLVLCSLVTLCRTQLRTVDILGRYGGEEFVILMPETNLEGGMQAAERIRREIEMMRVDALGCDCSVTASIGVTSLRMKFDQVPTVDGMLKHADEALYLAKAAGRNCVRGG